ncbi:MAG: hypothetical protein KF800_17915 [Lysobacter sp.]|nr:hypothetical protein [Lysobacter sp.]
MNTQTQPRAVFENMPFGRVLHTVAGQLVERATTVSTEGRGSQVLRWLLAIGAIFLAWRALRALKSIFWTLFGLGMMVYWTGMWRMFA